ncbi:MAG TPA: winged helix-turn-helix domain-containing protein [Solirubrobacterales bacterium]|nr:winged helix-turn-helix domain-containing protein [Solirubrobacterales bacterium]
MCPPSINISEGTYQRLHRHTLSFEDTPEDVILRLLDRAEGSDGAAPSPSSPSPPRSGGPSRAAPGSLLPLTAYWIPILRFLDENDGAAPSNDVLDALEERMGDKFTAKDREPLRSGAIRWRNRARFARLRMKERGLLSDRSHRGIWEITPFGRQFLAEEEVTSE